MAKKPNMTRYMVDTYRDLQDVLQRTHEAIDAAVDDAHEVIPSCTGPQFDLLLSTRDRLVALVMDVAAELDSEARELLVSLEEDG